MNNVVGIIGGDLRLVFLAEMLANENKKVYTYLLEKYNFKNNNITQCTNICEFKNVDTVITSIPLSKDKTNVNTPYSNKIFTIQDLIKNTKNKILISGAIDKEIKELAVVNNVKMIDLLENEELAILNAIPTAEGAIQIAMEKSKITIHDSNSLVLGFGRIGKILCKMLDGIGSKVYAEARKEYDLAKIKSYGYNAVHLNDLSEHLSKFDFIFNTIPYLILDKQKLEKVKKDCIIIDLASKPGRSRF